MITVKLPRATAPEQERLQHSQNELLRAKQELQWEQMQVQQRQEKIARERCISAILAAHKRERVPFEGLYPLSEELQNNASRPHELFRWINEAYRRRHVILSIATRFVAYGRHALEWASGLPSQLSNLRSPIEIALGLRDHHKLSSAQEDKLSSAQEGKLSSAQEGKLSSAQEEKLPSAKAGKRAAVKAGKRSSAKAGRRTNGLSSCMDRARASHWAP
jgi:hypothetical protein